MLRLFKELNSQGQTIVLVTHDPAAAAHASRVVFIRDGQIAGEGVGLDAAQIAYRLSPHADGRAQIAIAIKR